MDDFIKNTENELAFCRSKEIVLAELSDHFETKKEFFQSLGYDEEASFEKANEAMGDGTIVGARLKSIHSRGGGRFLLFSVFAVNCALLFASIPSFANSFFRPFFFAALTLILNSVYTAAAIKLKRSSLSICSIMFSFIPLCLAAPKLIYPIYNLASERFDSLKLFPCYILRIISAVIAIIIILIPNFYNIYHCRQIKHMKNTRQQNTAANRFVSACIAFSIFIAAYCAPAYAANNSYCKRQSAVFPEYIDFIIDIADKFDYNQTEALIDYIEASGYDFELTGFEYESVDFYYILTDGVWCIEIKFYSENGYSACIYTNTDINSSQKYLFTADENKLIESLGADEFEGKTGAAIGSTFEDIHKKMNEINYSSFSYDCFEDDHSFCYDWYLDMYLYTIFGASYYDFYFDDTDLCYYYDLCLD